MMIHASQKKLLGYHNRNANDFQEGNKNSYLYIRTVIHNSFSQMSHFMANEPFYHVLFFNLFNFEIPL